MQVAAFAALRVGPGRAWRVCRETFAELYLAWGEGVTFAGLAISPTFGAKAESTFAALQSVRGTSHLHPTP
eukprot:5907032-Prymnesium_polylepis.1